MYRLEKRDTSLSLSSLSIKKPCIIIAGSEGQGIRLPLQGLSVSISHDSKMESLNVSHDLAIMLYEFCHSPKKENPT